MHTKIEPQTHVNKNSLSRNKRYVISAVVASCTLRFVYDTLGDIKKSKSATRLLSTKIKRRVLLRVNCVV